MGCGGESREEDRGEEALVVERMGCGGESREEGWGVEGRVGREDGVWRGE